MNPNDLQKSIDIIKTNLEPLADKIGQSAAWTFELFVRQVYVDAFSELLFVIPGVICLYISKNIYKSGLRDRYKDIDPAKCFFMSVFLIAGLFMVLGPLSDLIAALLNPNYQAIKLIIELVKTQNK